jgi:hypothetical protein
MSSKEVYLVAGKERKNRASVDIFFLEQVVLPGYPFNCP